MNNGIDPVTGKKIGEKICEPCSFKDYNVFYESVKKQLKYAADYAMVTITKYEHNYNEINPAPLFSGTIMCCVVNEKDAYDRGAKYNNSSVIKINYATLAEVQKYSSLQVRLCGWNV